MSDEIKPRPIGSLIDDLGVVCEWDESELILDAIVIMRAYDPKSNGYRLSISQSPSTDFIILRGMFEHAHDYVVSGGFYVSEEDLDDGES